MSAVLPPGACAPQLPSGPELNPTLDPARGQTPTIELLFFPDYSAGNPYQRLMYDHMPGVEARPGTVAEALARQEQAPPPGGVVLHLHWLHPLLHGVKGEAAVQARRREVTRDLERFTAAGGRLFWTLHNEVSHESRHPEIERDLARDVARLAHGIHLHSTRLLAALEPRLILPRAPLIIAPHPPYAGLYPDAMTRAEARARLDLPAAAQVILLAGHLRPYKGVDELIAAYEALSAAHPEAWLLLAGKPLRPADGEALRARLAGLPRARIWPDYIPDAELQCYFRAADWAALPYRRILTSGSLLCALSFGLPCIAPRLGMIEDLLVEGENGYLYDPEESGGLEAALERALRSGPLRQADMARAARASLEGLSWEEMGRTLGAALRRICGEKGEASVEG